MPRSPLFAMLVLCGVLTQSLHAAERPGPPVDTRSSVVVTPAEREFIRAEMRELLAAVRDMLAAAARDADRLARAAQSAGMAQHRKPPATLPAKLPQAFKELGFGMHSEFDLIATDVDALRDVNLALGRIAQNLGRCVTCHATIRLDPAGLPQQQR
jgi:hypothetical protein